MVAQATTDAEGNYRLNLTASAEVFLVCSATRKLLRNLEQITWAVRPEAGATTLDLNEANQFAQPAS